MCIIFNVVTNDESIELIDDWISSIHYRVLDKYNRGCKIKNIKGVDNMGFRPKRNHVNTVKITNGKCEVNSIT